MDIQARPLLLACSLLLTACGSATPAARAPESAPAMVMLPPPAPASASAESEPPRAAPPPKEEVASMLGRSKEEAINVCQPVGQRSYLMRLRCVDGKPPRFGRRGNVGRRNEPKGDLSDEDLLQQMDWSRPLGPGEVDYHIVDVYEVECTDTTHEIFMDMYHCADPRTKKAPSGFTIAPEE
jgi:hypothetical protein